MADVQWESGKIGSFKEQTTFFPESKDEVAQVNINITPAENDLRSEMIHTPKTESMYGRSGLLIYIRTQAGLTHHLRGWSEIPVLVESAYQPVSIVAQVATHAPNIIAIAGGVGVTAVTPILLGRTGWYRLLWAVRSNPLVDSMEATLGASRFKQLNAVVFHNQRMDIARVLKDEIAECNGSEVTVVVSGPPKMADEVRVVVARLMASSSSVRLTLVEESFRW